MNSTEILEFKDKVRDRDGHQCCRCGSPQVRHSRKLHVHRVTPGVDYDKTDVETLCPSCHRRAHSKVGETEIVRIDSEVKKAARIIAAALDKSLPEYISELLRPGIERDLPKAKKVMDKMPQKQEE